MRLPCWNSFSFTNESQSVLWFGCPWLLLLLAVYSPWYNSNTSENISGKYIFICCHIWSTEYALCLYSDTVMKDKTINRTSLPWKNSPTDLRAGMNEVWVTVNLGQYRSWVLLRYQCDFSILSNVLHFLLKWSTQ